jgi:protein phosphatase
MNKIEYHGYSFIGRRNNNEDTILLLQINDQTWCFAIADGMGGAYGGEIASAETITALKTSLEASFQVEDYKDSSLKEILQTAISDAQEVIKDSINKKPHLNGMGTTLTVLLIHNDLFVWGNIGDSRIYLLHNDLINQITIDHTYIEQYKQDHQNDIPDNIASRYGNIITRAIGSEKDHPDLFPENEDYSKLEPGMVFLLCSDGLITSKIADKGSEFLPFILHHKKPQIIVEQLIAKAFQEGSSDNISAIIVCVDTKPIKKTKGLPSFRFPPEIKPTQHKMKNQKKTNITGFFAHKSITIAIILLSVALLSAAYLYLRNTYFQQQRRQTISVPDYLSQSSSQLQVVIEPEKLKPTNVSSLSPVMDETDKKFSLANLSETRLASATGISKLLVTFLNDPKIIADSLPNPLENIINSFVVNEKPAFIKAVHFYEIFKDNSRINSINISENWKNILLADSINSPENPRYIEEKNIILNKADSNRFVVVELDNIKKIKSQDYKVNEIVFAHESGLKNLTVLLSNLYYDYYHEANIIKDLKPLLKYLIIYNEKGKISFKKGEPINNDFKEKAKTTSDFYIQSLRFDNNKPCVDISVPVHNKNKSEVMRLGFEIEK